MLKWIALTGSMGAGKTTLAHALAETHMLINFTDDLKRIAVDLLRASGIEDISVERINERKQVYRRFLQQLGDTLQWGTSDHWVLENLKEWSLRGCPPAVFDNVRTPIQAQALRILGFTVVQLWLPPHLQRVDATECDRSHSAEQPLPDRLIDVVLDARKPVEYLVEEILTYDVRKVS